MKINDDETVDFEEIVTRISDWVVKDDNCPGNSIHKVLMDGTRLVENKR